MKHSLNCGFCGDKFVLVRSFEKHLETVHGGKKPVSKNVRMPKVKPLKTIVQNVGEKSVKKVARKSSKGIILKPFKSKVVMAPTDVLGDGPWHTLFNKESCSPLVVINVGQDSTNPSEKLVVCGVAGEVPKPAVKVVAMPERSKKSRKTFVCQTCSKGFPRKYELDLHESTHAGVYRHVCGICDRGFNKKSNYERHEMVHVEIRPFACAICGLAFKRSDVLTQHVAIHKGKKSFECKVCNKSFTRKSNLEVHRKIHSEMKPCYCMICKKAFRNRSALDFHFELHFCE